MSRLTDLLARAKARDAQLGAELEREFRALSERRAFGLNFERHQPEAVELPKRPVRKGDKVRLLPLRGETKKGDQRLWLVMKTVGSGANRTASLVLADDEAQTYEAAADDLVVVAEFSDFIYPGLVTTGKVERGGDKPFHTVINAENYHALKALTYTHRGKIDVIYIDPPYNSGAKDWKYNNDYVEGEDLYRHSKWLAMLERRLMVARELLNPRDSVLIVTIDEKEYLRLGLLLEQMFPESGIQMVTSVINPFGVARQNELSRVEEYIFYLRIGSASLGPPNDSRRLLAREEEEGEVPSDDAQPHAETFWFSFMRAGSNSTRTHSPGCHYPIFVTDDGKFHSVGHPLAPGASRQDVSPPKGTEALWPMKTNKTEGVWQASREVANRLFANGYARIGRFNASIGRCSVTYLREGTIARIEGKELVISKDGEIEVLRNAANSGRTVWAFASHNATSHGTKLLAKILPGRKFPYPKSLYAVEDCLRVAVAKKTNTVILDFFAGSGTTAHAVMRLNKQDGGRRQCILITNNEVGAAEQEALRGDGLRPTDEVWDEWGICDYITKPRIAAAINGMTPTNKAVKGDYKFNDKFPIADGLKENAEFFTLTYETPHAIDHNKSFRRIAPLLWMRAGSQGKRIDELPENGWAVAETYGLLTDLDEAEPWLNAMSNSPNVRVAFIVTDDSRNFEAVARGVQEQLGGVEPVRLYESYLTNFRFASGGEA